MLYNFRLSLVLAKYCGVELGPYLQYDKITSSTHYGLCWVQPMMGLIFPPYMEIQCLLWERKVVWGDE